MYTLEKYTKDLNNLVISIMIKHNHIGVLMNDGLVANGLTVSKDKKQWKYYLNLCGVAHPTNNTVMITVVETGTIVPLTRDLLLQYPSTLRELDLRLNLYNTLIENYPSDILYINGCIAPSDINTIIEVPDGTIVGVSKYYIEPQEYSLVRELNKYITGFFSRWYIIDYGITDELYMASVMGVLYSNLPNVIASKRLEDVGTVEAHSFHVEHFFRSHLDLWDSVQYLNKTTIWWLYRNLTYLMNNVGTEEAFKLVLNKVFNTNAIGVATYELANANLSTSTDTNLMVPVFTTNEPVINLNALNRYYTPAVPQLSIASAMTIELNSHGIPILPNATMLPTIIEDNKKRIPSVISIPQNTKVIDFGKISVYKLYSNSLLETILDYWLVSATNTYTTPSSFIDPNTKIKHVMSPRTGVLLFYYLLLIKLGDPDPTISAIKHRNIIKASVTKQELSSGLLTADGTGHIIDIVLGILPANSYIIRNPVDFMLSIEPVTNMYRELWSLDSNVNNSFLSTNIKKIVSRLYKPGMSNIVPSGVTTNLRQYLLTFGIDINVTGVYNLDTSMTDLLKVFTGFEFKEEVLIKQIYDSHRTLLEKLTSYSIQTVAPDISVGDIKVPYTTIAVTHGQSGYVEVTKANIIQILETMNGTAAGVGNNFITYTKAVNLNSPTVTDLDYNNQLMLVSKNSNPRRNRATLTHGSVYTEILRASYIHYSPYAGSSGNNIIFKEQSVATNYGGAQAPTTYQRSDSLIVSSSNNKVTTKPTVGAELIGHDYPIFGPNNNSNTANNMQSNTVSGVNNQSIPNAPITTPGNNVVFAKGVNSSATIKPTMTVGVSGGTYQPYAPNSTNGAGNNVQSNTIAGAATDPANTPVSATIIDPNLVTKATGNAATVTVNVTAQVVGNNTKKP